MIHFFVKITSVTKEYFQNLYNVICISAYNTWKLNNNDHKNKYFIFLITRFMTWFWWSQSVSSSFPTTCVNASLIIFYYSNSQFFWLLSLIWLCVSICSCSILCFRDNRLLLPLFLSQFFILTKMKCIILNIMVISKLA